MGNYSYTGTANDGTDTAAYTFAGIAIGAADPDRIVAVIIWSRGSSGQILNSVTIGGVAATKWAGTQTGASGSGMSCNIYYAAVPTGTTADVVATFATGQLRAACAVYRLVGYDLTPTDSATALATPSDLAVDTAADGVVLAGSCVFAGATATWDEAAEDLNDAVETGMQYSAASGSFAAATDRAVSIEWSSGTVVASAAVSLAPAAGPPTTTRRRFAAQILS